MRAKITLFYLFQYLFICTIPGLRILECVSTCADICYKVLCVRWIDWVGKPKEKRSKIVTCLSFSGTKKLFVLHFSHEEKKEKGRTFPVNAVSFE